MLLSAGGYGDRTALTGFGEITLDAQSLLEMLDCLGRSALLKQRGTPVDVCVREVRLNSERNLEVRDRLRWLALLNKCRAPVGVGGDEVGCDTKSLLKLFDRRRRLPLTEKGEAPVVVRLGVGPSALLKQYRA